MEQAFTIELIYKGKTYQLPAHIHAVNEDYLLYMALPRLDITYRIQSDGEFTAEYSNFQKKLIDTDSKELIKIISTHLFEIITL